MSIYRRRKRGIPELNTASLPDLIFTILFFFMLVTHMRKTTVKVKYQVPQGTELTKLVKKSAISYIYIGEPMTATDAVSGDSLCVQLNDKIVDLKDVKGYLSKERHTMSAADRKQMSVSVRADKATPMGTINDLKQSLRESNVLKVNFAATHKKQ
ncbi:ExbD/TolR family protein [Prevotella falsenii]|uniref:ExbD/TolR family protein n=1 Tax=Prevotella falsenii TaxID=515414 RepID=UPI0004680FED|nr:biopolymer transporter ExbD [Prevotella falsenii]